MAMPLGVRGRCIFGPIVHSQGSEELLVSVFDEQGSVRRPLPPRRVSPVNLTTVRPDRGA